MYEMLIFSSKLYNLKKKKKKKGALYSIIVCKLG